MPGAEKKATKEVKIVEENLTLAVLSRGLRFRETSVPIFL